VEQALDSLAHFRYHDSVAVVAYHPFPEDQLSINPDDSIRVAPYPHVRGQPAVVLDGYRLVEIPSDPGRIAQALADEIDAVKSDSPFVNLTVTGVIDSTRGRLLIAATMDTMEPGADLRLHCVLTEDSLIAGLGGRYDHVPRKFLPDLNGKPFYVARGDTLSDTLSFTPPDSLLRRLHAVVFVENEQNHRVVQAAELTRFQIMEDK
jgi:hypothetical protein